MNRKDVIENLKNRLNDLHNGYQTYLEHGGKQDIETESDIEALNMAIEALQEPERKKGQWIILSSNEDSAVCKCSVCGEDFIFYNGEFFPNYCGDCGSDMRGEEG